MEVLPPPSHIAPSRNSFSTTPSLTGLTIITSKAPTSPIYERRSSQPAYEQGSLKSMPSLIRLETSPFEPSSVNSGPSGQGRFSRRPTFHGFLPLPVISASPICTPTSSSSSKILSSSDSEFEGDRGSCSGLSTDYTTAPPTPSDTLSPHSLLPTPTWISTPPTPPPKLFRRSVTCVARRPWFSSVSPSTSFPLSHVQPLAPEPPRRSLSEPLMSTSTSTSSNSSISLGKRPRSRAGGSPSPLRRTSITPAEIFEGSSGTSPKRSRPLFHIAHEVSSDHEDDEHDDAESPGRSQGDVSSSDYFDDKWSTEKRKDNVRRYHALMELLSTEVCYTMDLRVLITVYLRNLSTLTCRSTVYQSTFGRTSAFSPISRTNSYTPASAAPSISTPDSQGLQPLSHIHPKDKDKGMVRYLFTNNEVELLVRNGEEVLALHEHFVEELRAAMTSLGFSMDLMDLHEVHQQSEKADRLQSQSIQNIDKGIAIVSAKFATEASRFNSYEAFCAGHPEALNIMRRVQQQYPVEWEAFEERCSSLVSDLIEASTTPTSATSPTNATENSRPFPSTPEVASQLASNTFSARERKRTSSLTSLDGAVRSLRSLTSTTASSPRRDRSSRRLAFVDYMIKPIQRICKYPMLLDQLKIGKSLKVLTISHDAGPPDSHVAVETAATAMRHVTSLVDAARTRQDLAMQSQLISARISVGTVMPCSVDVSSQIQVITPSFVSSLGICLLAGSLDVLHYQSYKPTASSANAKYLGAFLYCGAYLILVKVVKGKVYEPRHWFRLAELDIVDVEDEDVLLPHSFRLSCKGHVFDLVASCHREKGVWLSSIEESFNRTPGEWVNEPVSSLHVDGKGELVPSTLDGPFETINALPTIQSIPELGKNGDLLDFPETTGPFTTDTVKSRKAYRHDAPSRSEISPLPSRRSSTASVKAIFSPLSSDSDTIVVRRSSPSARAQVEMGLQDVISQPCFIARSHAASREEELFQAPNANGTFSRSSSGLSIAKSRLRRYESVRVPRRKSFVDAVEASDNTPRTRNPALRARSLTGRRRAQKLSIISTTSEGDSNLFTPGSAPSPSPFSACSSIPSNAGSASTSPLLEPTFLTTESSHPQEVEVYRKISRSNSLVNNLRGFFSPRPTSPIVHLPPSPKATPKAQQTSNRTITPTLLRRWVKGQRHRRANSDPQNIAIQTNSDETPVLPDFVFGTELRLTQSPDSTVENQTTIRPPPQSPQRPCSSSIFIEG